MQEAREEVRVKLLNLNFTLQRKPKESQEMMELREQRRKRREEYKLETLRDFLYEPPTPAVNIFCPPIEVATDSVVDKKSKKSKKKKKGCADDDIIMNNLRPPPSAGRSPLLRLENYLRNTNLMLIPQKNTNRILDNNRDVVNNLNANKVTMKAIKPDIEIKQEICSIYEMITSLEKNLVETKENHLQRINVILSQNNDTNNNNNIVID